MLAFGRLTNVVGIININEKNFREEKLYAANSSYLTMLPVRLLEGNDSSALDEPFTAVISQSIAKKYFGAESAIGKTFRLNSGNPFRITGIFKDIPDNTHLKFNILISWPTYILWRGKEVETAWNWDGYFTYIRLQKGTDIAAFEKKMNDFTTKVTEERCLGLFGLSWFIIVQRTKEIGMRKVNGASVFDILRLISGEFFRLILVGIIIAAPIAYLVSTKWLEKYPFRVAFNWWLFILAGFVIFLISALTISYNTILIAHTNPARSLKYE